MRDSLGDDVFLLACGAPIIPSLGLCDALRVGADVFIQWENPISTRLLYNMASPGTRNAIRTVINRLWLNTLVQLDPDVVFFRSEECVLTDEQKSLLWDLALICNFKSTSDVAQLLNSKERKNLFMVFSATPEIRQIDRNKFHIDGRSVDFSYVVSPLKPLKGFETVKGCIIGWLGNRALSLKVVDIIQKREIKRIKRRLSRKSSI
jgi:alpha-galactosidase